MNKKYDVNFWTYFKAQLLIKFVCLVASICNNFSLYHSHRKSFLCCRQFFKGAFVLIGLFVIFSTNGHALTIGIPKTDPWGDEKGGVFQTLLEKRLSKDAYDRINFVPLAPHLMTQYLSKGWIDGAISTNLTGISTVAKGVAQLGTIQLGVTCLKIELLDRKCEIKKGQKLAFWGPYEAFKSVFSSDDSPEYYKTLTYQEGIEAMMLEKADGLFGTRYSIAASFQKLNLEFASFIKVVERDLQLWVPPSNVHSEFENIIQSIANSPISHVEIETVLRARIQANNYTTYKISLPHLDKVNNDTDQNFLRTFATQMDLMNSRISIISSQPFERSLRSVQAGLFDIHLFIIEHENMSRVYRDLVYVGDTLFNVEFKVYVKDPEVFDPKTKKFRAGARVASDITHAKLFGKPVSGHSCVECLVKMLEVDRVDAIVYAAPQIDPLIEGHSNIHAYIFDVFPVRAVMNKNNSYDLKAWVNTGMDFLNRFGLVERLLSSTTAEFKPAEKEVSCADCFIRQDDRMVISMARLQNKQDGTPQVWLKTLGQQMGIYNDISFDTVQNDFFLSLKSVLDGEADFHLGMIETDQLQHLYPELTYVGPSLYKMAFEIFYINEDVFDQSTGKISSKARVMSDGIHAPLIDPNMMANPCGTCALSMLATGRVDAIIFPKNELNEALAEFSDFGIKNHFYKEFNVKSVMNKNGPQEAIETWLKNGLKGTKKTGYYDILLEESLNSFGVYPIKHKLSILKINEF